MAAADRSKASTIAILKNGAFIPDGRTGEVLLRGSFMYPAISTMKRRAGTHIMSNGTKPEM